MLYKTKFKQISFHALIWFLFILYEVVFVTVLSKRSLNWSSEFLYYVLAILLFYSHAHFSIPFALKARKIVIKLMRIQGSVGLVLGADYTRERVLGCHHG